MKKGVNSFCLDLIWLKPACAARCSKKKREFGNKKTVTHMILGPTAKTSGDHRLGWT